MRETQAASLACIDDGGDIEIRTIEQRDGEEILAGKLACRSCGRFYEIQGGVPCMLNLDEFKETDARFGDQWTWFLEGKFENPAASSLGESHEFIVNDFFDLTGLSAETLAGKRILDAGSGASKIAFHLTQEFPNTDFEIVSMELTRSVYAAARRLHERRTPYVRASVFAPGLKPASFDVVYSSGVLHHTPDPRRAFESLVPLVKPGGTISTWMYSKKFNPFLDVTGVLWPLTRHMPTKMILAVAYLLSPLFWIVFRLGSIYKKVFKPTSWRWKWVMPLSLAAIRLHLFDYMHTFYRFRYWPEEIVPWYEQCGLEDIRVLRPGSTAMRARRPLSAGFSPARSVPVSA